MANIKISDLTAAAAASGTQEFEVNDSLTSKKVTGAQVLAYVESNLTIQNNAVTTAKIADNNVTLAKLQDIATASILGRNTAGTGDPEVLTGAQARTIIGADNASNLTTGTVGTARLASGTANSTTFLRGDQTWAAAGSTADVQTFNSTATWTKPTAGQTMARIQIWGGGGGGGKSSGTATTTGGGGAYNEVTVPLSYLASSITVTVGGGGAGATVNGNGSAGGNSSITLSTAWNGVTTWAAYGGGPGGNGTTPGGGGGGTTSAGAANGIGGNPKLLIGANYVSVCVGLVPLYAGYSDANVAYNTPTSLYHGGAGTSNAGGGSYYGGGGGSKSGSPVGASLYGGAGGVAAAGTAPGGGGGAGAANVNGFAGAAGRVIITCW